MDYQSVEIFRKIFLYTEMRNMIHRDSMWYINNWIEHPQHTIDIVNGDSFDAIETKSL